MFANNPHPCSIHNNFKLNFFDNQHISDADLERLYEQWEEDDDPLPVDELPEWDPRKPQPQVSIYIKINCLHTRICRTEHVPR